MTRHILSLFPSLFITPTRAKTRTHTQLLSLSLYQTHSHTHAISLSLLTSDLVEGKCPEREIPLKSQRRFLKMKVHENVFIFLSKKVVKNWCYLWKVTIFEKFIWHFTSLTWQYLIIEFSNTEVLQLLKKVLTRKKAYRRKINWLSNKKKVILHF